MNTLGTRIAENRKKKGLSQEQLADILGVSSQAVSKWENDISCPDISLLPQIADYFNITIDELLRGGNRTEVQLVEANQRKDINKMVLRINISSSDGDEIKMNLPLALVKTALEVGLNMPEISGNKKFDALKDLDLNSILLMAESGVIGKLIEIKSTDGDIIDIYIE